VPDCVDCAFETESLGGDLMGKRRFEHQSAYQIVRDNVHP
jgi:hypothetical protein